MARRQSKNAEGGTAPAPSTTLPIEDKREPLVVVATRPAVLLVPATISVEGADIVNAERPKSVDPTKLARIYIDRGVNFVAANRPTWQLAQVNDFSGAFVKDALATEFVGIRHTVKSVNDMVDPSTGRRRARDMELALERIFAWLKEQPQARRYFVPDIGQRLPMLTVCRLGADADRQLLGAHYLVEAAKVTGAANARNNNSLRHVGALHDWAMLRSRPDQALAEACRGCRRRYQPAA